MDVHFFEPGAVAVDRAVYSRRLVAANGAATDMQLLTMTAMIVGYLLLSPRRNVRLAALTNKLHEVTAELRRKAGRWRRSFSLALHCREHRRARQRPSLRPRAPHSPLPAYPPLPAELPLQVVVEAPRSHSHSLR
jgi:hypothetical protein